MEKAKYLISQVSPDMVSKFLMGMRKNKYYRNQDIENYLFKKGELTTSFPKYISEIATTLSYFGVLEYYESDKFYLSSFGIVMKKVLLKDRSFFFEIYHLFHYYLFDLNDGNFNFLPYKSYQILCDYLFDSTQIPSSKTIADYIDGEIKETYKVQGSFSEVCISRGIAWIRQLDPPILNENNDKIVRKPNHIGILLLGIDYYYRISDIKYNDPLFIDSKTKHAISKSILLTPQLFGDVLDDLSKKYPTYLTLKYNVAGSYIILKKRIHIADLY